MDLESTTDSVAEAYSLLQTLTADRTFLCTDGSSNIVVLKRLSDDCLHRSQLHPSIKERLAKVRELPHPRLATLRGVERWQGMAYMVWNWLDGDTWADRAVKPTENFSALASALVAAVDAMHELGIVHGNLHGRNVIVRPDGQVWLTDVSPYLYTDPAADLAAVIRILDEAAPYLPATPAQRLGKLLDDTAAGRCGLRELSHWLRGLEVEDNSIPEVKSAGGYRITSLVSAALVLLTGVGLWIGIHWYTAKSLAPMPTKFPPLKAAVAE